MKSKEKYPSDAEPIIEQLKALNNEMALKIKTLNCMIQALLTYGNACSKAAEDLKKNLNKCSGAKPVARPKSSK